MLLSVADPAARALCEEILSERGCQVVSLPDSTAAWQAFADEPVPLVILDGRSSGLDGFEICRRIRRSGASVRPVVLILVDPAEPRHIQAALAAGADGYLVRPLDSQTFRARLGVIERQLGLGAQADGASDRVETTLHLEGRALVEAIPEGILLVNGAGAILDANTAAARAFRRSVAELVGHSLDRLVTLGTGAPRGGLSEVLQAARWEGPQRFDHSRGARPDGTQFLCETSVTALEGGPVDTRWVVVVRETGRREFQEFQVRESVKMNAVATLAAGIANDFNNALAAVSGSIEAARLQLTTAGHSVPADLQSAMEATRAAARLVRRLLNFARPAQSRRQPLDPASIVAEAKQILNKDLDPRITFVTRLDHDDWRVAADLEQLTDLVVSLGYNAIEAMPDGGVLSITTTRTSAGTWTNGVPKGPASRAYLRIDVSDTGRGISPDVLPRIFEPFFTTKESGRGSGMGLSTAYSVLGQHEGGIAVESSHGSGTTFQIFLPRTFEAAPSRIPSLQGEPEPGTGTILLVDDEAPVRRPLRQALEICGYTVIEAVDGLDALRAYSRDESRIRLVVLDVKMPRMSGWEVLGELKRRVPTLPVILTSGYSRDDSAPPEGALVPDAFLNKPYELVELTQTVRRLLEGQRASSTLPAGR